MKILFVTDLFPISNNNEPKTLNYFVNNWKQLGHEIDVIRPNFLLNSFIRGKKLLKEGEYHQDGVRILNLNFHTPFWFNIKKKLPYCFDIESYDVIIAHMPSGSLFAKKLLKRSNKPLIVSVHMSDIEVLTAPAYRFYFRNALKKVYKKADLVSARSYILADKIAVTLPQVKEKTFVAYSGIEEEYIEPQSFFREKLDSLYKTKFLKIVTVASLIKRKRIEVVLSALAKLQGIKWKYTIIGSGSELNELRRYARYLKIENKVDFLLDISREKVLEKLKESNVFVMLSERETFGMAYLEAMAKGNIVIARKNDGVDGIINNLQNGFLCQTSFDLANVLVNLVHMDHNQLKNIYDNFYSTIHHYNAQEAALNYINNVSRAIEKKL